MVRPVQRPPLRPDYATYPIHDLLLDAFGSYCSLCERRLHDMCWGWNAQTRTIAPLHPPPGDWDQLLLLCHNCRAAALAAQAGQLDAPLLLPDRARTFRITGPSPFIYDLQSVEILYLADDGEPLGQAETAQRVLVHGATSEARATIDYFALNTRYYHPASNTLRIPHRDYVSLVDRRVEQRTEAWNLATEQAPLFVQAEQPVLRALLILGRQMIASQGFWSTWATVLWRTLQDRAALTRMLMPPRADAAPVADGQVGFYGQASAFRATRSDWLD